MTSTCSAAATGLPSLANILPPLPRRGFLRQLASLPLIGGSVSLFGSPTAVAEPVTDAMLWTYKDWLHFEHRMLCHEMTGYGDIEQARWLERHHGAPIGCDWHFQFPTKEGSRLAGWPDAPQPSTRAALVLSTVGCDWRGD